MRFGGSSALRKNFRGGKFRDRIWIVTSPSSGPEFRLSGRKSFSTLMKLIYPIGKRGCRNWSSFGWLLCKTIWTIMIYQNPENYDADPSAESLHIRSDQLNQKESQNPSYDKNYTTIIWPILKSGIIFIKFARGPDENNNRNENFRNGHDHKNLSDWDLCQSRLIFVLSQLCEMEPSFSQIVNKDHFTKRMMPVLQRMRRLTHPKAVEIAEGQILTEKRRRENLKKMKPNQYIQDC
jgi:hypothetical protein